MDDGLSGNWTLACENRGVWARFVSKGNAFGSVSELPTIRELLRSGSTEHIERSHFKWFPHREMDLCRSYTSKKTSILRDQAFWSLKITHRGRFLSHEATFNSTPKETVLRTLYAL